MKIKITFFLLFSATTLFGQTNDSLGIGENDFLNQCEVNYIDSIFQNDPIGNFKDQKIVFLSHRSGVQIISKKEFFDKFIKPDRNNHKTPSFSTRDVKPDEKRQSGGYNFIFIAPCGDISNKERSKVFKQLKEQEEGKKK